MPGDVWVGIAFLNGSILRKEMAEKDKEIENLIYNYVDGLQ